MLDRVYSVNVRSHLRLRALPNDYSSVLARLQPGQIVARLDLKYRNGWYAVFADLGEQVFVGYVAARFLSPLWPQSDPEVEAADAGAADPHDEDATPHPAREGSHAAGTETAADWADLLDASEFPHVVGGAPSDEERSLWTNHFVTPPNPGRWRGTVGLQFTPDEFARYLELIAWKGKFQPDKIVLHHTYNPSLGMRPKGFSQAHIRRLGLYYNTPESDGGPGGGPWLGGPHIFVDATRISILNPLHLRGTHCRDFNGSGVGIEMLGNFIDDAEARRRNGARGATEVDDFNAGRGRRVRVNAVSAMVSLMERLMLGPDALRFHRDCKGTLKSCPGGQVDHAVVKRDILTEFEARERRRASTHALV
ncbi:MAG: N-acetylmuramoyl-L-alanine amidase [Pseudomonadota bacterium]